MAIPSQNDYHSATLRHYSNGNILHMRDIKESIAKEFNLTEEDKLRRLSSGELSHNNRIRWAQVSLERAGLLTRVKRGLYRISLEGANFLKAHSSFTEKDLMNFPEFHDWVKNNRTLPSISSSSTSTDEKETTHHPSILPQEETCTVQISPEETLDNAIRTLNNELATELLEAIKKNSPNFFEQLVVDLMLAMGYGGSRSDAGTAFKTTNDGGIDGVIKEDALGLSKIYLQAKRWKEESTVGRPLVQEFVGALTGHHASKGVFITTSKFSAGAIEFTKYLPQPVILIDGEKLVQLMIEYNVGVTTRQTYEVKRLDLDYFSEDE